MKEEVMYAIERRQRDDRWSNERITFPTVCL